MSKLVIERWDPVLIGNNSHPMPMISVKVDEAYRKYFEENRMMVAVTINDTNSIYDGKTVGAVVNPSAVYPSYRPTFYNKTQYYTLTLSAQWYEYPKFNGTATVAGFVGINAVKLEEPKFTVPQPVAPFPLPTTVSENFLQSNNNLGKREIIGVLVLLLLLFIGLLVSSLNSGENKVF